MTTRQYVINIRRWNVKCSNNKYMKGYVQSQPGIKICISIHFPYPQFRYRNIQNSAKNEQQCQHRPWLMPTFSWSIGTTRLHLPTDTWFDVYSIPPAFIMLSHLAHATSIFSSSFCAVRVALNSFCCWMSSSVLRWLIYKTDKISRIILLYYEQWK